MQLELKDEPNSFQFDHILIPPSMHDLALMILRSNAKNIPTLSFYRSQSIMILMEAEAYALPY